VTSRQRVMTTLQHEEPDRVPVDMGSGPVTGIAASTLFRLRQALGLARPTDRVKVIEPYQMLGEVHAGAGAGRVQHRAAAEW